MLEVAARDEALNAVVAIVHVIRLTQACREARAERSEVLTDVVSLVSRLHDEDLAEEGL